MLVAMGARTQRLLAGSLFAAAIAMTAVCQAAGTVTGHARFERIKGKPQMGHVELYESNLFLSPDGGAAIGPSYRLGAPPGQAPRGDGFYSLSVPAGTWSLLVNQPLFFIRPKVLPGVTVRDGQTTTRHVELPIDYSTYFTSTWTSFEQVWVQTFIATGTSITGVSWKLAGTNATRIQASLHADDGTANPVLWPLVSAQAAKSDEVAAITDNWVRWRSGEVPAVPGRRYAVKLTGTAGGDLKFAVFHRAKDANSYAGGRAHDQSGVERDFDLNITVFSDNDATAVLLNKTSKGLGDLVDGYFGGRWGQTFRATLGTSLAAVDVWAAGANNRWDLDFTFRVLRGGPGGPQVGPAKTTKAAYQAFGAGLHGVSFNPGEVPLEPGQTYYVEFTNPEGFNPYVTEGDTYAAGAAYQDGSLRSRDLSMTILVYTETGGAISGRVTDAASGAGIPAAAIEIVELGRSILADAAGSYSFLHVPPGSYRVGASKTGYARATRSGVEVVADGTIGIDFSLQPVTCTTPFTNPSFEGDLAGWSRYGDARNRTIDSSGGGWFAGIRAYDGNRFHGNEINGCCLNGGLYQRFCAVAGHRYRASVWSNIYWLSGSADDATSRIGLDGGGGTEPAGPVTWSAWDRQPSSGVAAWRRISVETVATGPLMTVFLDFRQRSAAGNQWRINCFDLIEVVDLDAAAGASFGRGDCNASGVIDVSDAVFLLLLLYQAGRTPPCEDACDVNDDGRLDVSDAIRLLDFIFRGGAAPPPPGAACGPDPTADALGCATPSC
jgi:hypothetical protein